MAESKNTAPKLIYESQESLYKKAVDTMNADQLIVQFAFKEENYLKAAEMFKEVGDYEDASELEKRCRELAERTKEEEKEYKYQLAMEQLEEAKSAKGYEKAAKLFQNAGGYKDSEEQGQLCLDTAARMNRHRKRKNAFAAGSCLAVVAAGFLFFMSPYWKNIKNHFMGDGIEKFVSGDKSATEEITLENAAVGEKVEFGNHVWYVLERNDSQLKMILAQAEKFEEFRHTPFHETQEDVTWENSSIRAWLNSYDFLEEHFSEEDKEKIQTVIVENADNAVYGTDGGNDTQDKVFLLSTDEVTQYYDILKFIRMNIWLRTPGNQADTAAFMASNTAIMDYGCPVSNTNFYTCPVICISVE